jgi:hypothetical protein
MTIYLGVLFGGTEENDIKLQSDSEEKFETGTSRK